MQQNTKFLEFGTCPKCGSILRATLSSPGEKFDVKFTPVNGACYEEMREFILDIANHGRGAFHHRCRAMEIRDKYGLNDLQCPE